MLVPRIIPWLHSKPPPCEAGPLRPPGNSQERSAGLARQKQGGCGPGSAFPVAALERNTSRCGKPIGTCRTRLRIRAHDDGRVRQRTSTLAGRLRKGGGEADPQAGQTHFCGRCAGRGGFAMVVWGSSPALTSGPIPWLCRLCSGPPAFAVNPRWGYARHKFRKIRFRFFVCGPGTFLPASGSLESAARCLGK